MRRIVRKSYRSLSSSVVSSLRTADSVVATVSQSIRKEIKHIMSLEHDSILKDSTEAVRRFSWETVWLELTNEVPTLMKLLATLLPNDKSSRNIICVIVCMILKKRFQKMSLVQRAISILLYSTGSSKQVY